MSAIKQLLEELKPTVQAGKLQDARNRLASLKFPLSEIPFQLDAIKRLIQRQRAFVGGHPRSLR
jgi:hypothetical protein